MHEPFSILEVPIGRQCLQMLKESAPRAHGGVEQPADATSQFQQRVQPKGQPLPIDPVQHIPKHIKAGDAVEAGSLFAGQTQLPALRLGEFLRRAHEAAQVYRPTEQPQRD